MNEEQFNRMMGATREDFVREAKELRDLMIKQADYWREARQELALGKPLDAEGQLKLLDTATTAAACAKLALDWVCWQVDDELPPGSES